MNPPTYLPRFAGALVFTSQSGQFLFQQERNRFYLVHLTLLGIGEPGEFLSTSKNRLSISALGFEKHTGARQTTDSWNISATYAGPWHTAAVIFPVW